MRPFSNCIAPAKAKAAAKKTVRKASPKVTQTKKTGGFIQNVKDSIHTGMEAMGDMLRACPESPSI